jgi:radical SAM superfamily enzyme YgiQ (UPF0313 family)
MKILLVYPPFCTPASPPYSITRIYAFLKNNLQKGHTLEVVDLNVEFHTQKFPEYQEYYKKLDHADYDKVTYEYRKETSKVYSDSNKSVVTGKNPELFDDMLAIIKKIGPDIVAFSVVYSSQCFYTFALCKELEKQNIKTVVGGPAVNEKLKTVAKHLSNELELLEFIEGKRMEHDKLDCSMVLDFNIYNLKDYFTPEPVIPIKTVSSCYYRRCAFCTHHHNEMYHEFSLDDVKKSLKKGQRIFIIDDMLHKKRLLDLAAIMKPLKISWMCQLKPTIDLDKDTLKTLHDSGLNVVMWGVESGCDRILVLMDKGTNKKDISKVLKDSHDVDIKNGVFIIFGFPSETKDEFIETIEFLKQNTDRIDIVSTSIFGLQKGTPIYADPERFGITKIKYTERTILEPAIQYDVKTGLSQQEAKLLRYRYRKTLEKLDKYPRMMNFFREHMLLSASPRNI